MLSRQELYEFLEEKAALYNRPVFISHDPVSIPHGFNKKEDIEISGFLTAVISWGNRRSILTSATRLMMLMENSPFEFVTSAGEEDLQRFANYSHRTFNGTDCAYFIRSLQKIYREYGSLEAVFSKPLAEGLTIMESIVHFRDTFFSYYPPERSAKHISNAARNSAAKRINMFLRWMVRKDNRGVDFGIWQSIPPSALYCPLDIHTGNTARKLGLLSRKYNDWMAAEELTCNLRRFDPSDPVKYDFALFGLGIHEKF